MHILEKFSISKTGLEKYNEDRMIINENFIAVVDGMTPKDNTLFKGYSSGRKAVDLIEESLSKMKNNIGCYEAIDQLSKTLENYYKEHNIYELAKKHAEKRMGASILILSLYKKEIWQVGDCKCIVDGKVYANDKLIDKYLAYMRSDLIKEYLNEYTIKELIENDFARKDIESYIKLQYQYQNSHIKSLLSYAVIDGFSIAKDEIIRIDVSSSHRVIMASDGYPELKESLEESEKRLEQILEEDPLCYKLYPSTKGIQGGNSSFDDRSYIQLIL